MVKPITAFLKEINLKNKYRFHILGLVHLPVARRYNMCAFTQKIYKMCQMLMSLGHEIILFGAESSDAPCTEFIQTHTLNDIRDTWGSGDNRYELGYNHKKGFKHDFNKPRTPVTLKYYENCINKINKHKKPDDFLLLSQGIYQKPISDKVNLYLTCEPGVGYRGSFSNFKAFESSYLQNFTYGSKNPNQCINGNYYDRVIPNYFDPDDFEYREKKDDYFLYIGRLIQRKGILTAYLVAKELGVKLKIAGQGMKFWDGHKLVGEDFEIEGDNLEFVGCVDIEERKKLFAGAKATFVPTIYLEAFGGVSIESLFSGTPVITTNFGVFPETIPSGIVGYRCNTLNDFIQAAKNIDKIKPQNCRDYAMQNFSLEQVKWQFEQWFQDLYMLWESSVDSQKKGWHRIHSDYESIV